MELEQLDYKAEKTNTNNTKLSDAEKESIIDFQDICKECKEAFEMSNESLLLQSSEKFEEAAGNNKIYPNDFIDDVALIEDTLTYLNSFRNSDFMRNILKGLLHIFECCDYASLKFISFCPSDLLLAAFNDQSAEVAKVAFQVLQTLCRYKEGIDFVIHSDIIKYCFDTIYELLEIIDKDERHISVEKDSTICLLNTFAEIVKEFPLGTDENIQNFLNIVHLCFESQHFRSFIEPGVKILGYLLHKQFYKPVIDSGLFKQVMDFLFDPSLRPSYLYCLKLATYFTSFPPDTELIYDEYYSSLEQIPLHLLIYQFMIFDEKDFAQEYLTIFLNIVIISSDYLQIFIDFTKDEEQDRKLTFLDFLKTLIDWMGKGNLEIRKSAYWLVWNMLYIGTRSQRLIIFNSGIFDYLEDSIDFDDTHFIIKVVIASIKRMIKSFRQLGIEFSEPFEQYVLKMREFVKDLYYNDNPKISDESLAFFKEYYPELRLQ